MPIKGMTDDKSLTPKLPRVGKLRKGGERDSNKPGEDLDHFRFTSNSPEVEEAFKNAYGDEPRMVNAILYYDTLEENFPTWIEAWDGSGLVMRSDGEYWRLWREGSQYKRGKKEHRDVDGQSEVGRLSVLIPELLQQGIRGVVTLETHSKNDILHIASVLKAAERERGTLRWANFVLRRVEENISVPGWGNRSGKRSRADKWLVKIELPRKFFAQLAAPEEEEQPALTSEKPALVDEKSASNGNAPTQEQQIIAKHGFEDGPKIIGLMRKGMSLEEAEAQVLQSDIVDGETRELTPYEELLSKAHNEGYTDSDLMRVHEGEMPDTVDALAIALAALDGGGI